ncbi:MAG: radical SAM protein, partial [Pyrobaculum sp.]
MALSGLTRKDAEFLINEADIFVLADAAHQVARKYFGDVVTFVNNVVVNYSDVCVAKCPICAFYRPPGQGYIKTPQEVAALVEQFVERYGVTELHINGGFNPLLTPEYFDELFKTIKKRARVVVKGPTLAEVEYYASLWRTSREEVLSRWKEAGLDAISGGGAEVFAEEVRKIVAPHKISGEQWIETAKIAHRLGISTNATLLYGHVESPRHVVDHIFRVKELQVETGGVLLFIPVKYNPANTELYIKGVVKRPAPSIYDLK